MREPNTRWNRLLICLRIKPDPKKITVLEEEDVEAFLLNLQQKAFPRPLSDDELGQLDTLSPKCRELWERCEKLSDEEAIQLLNTLDPTKDPTWVTALTINISRRFIHDFHKTPRKHARHRGIHKT